MSNSFARFAYALILPAMRADLEWSYSQAGSINTVNALGYLFGALLTRALVARLGNRALYGWGMVLTSVAITATGFVRDFEALMAVRVLAGVGGAAVFICGGALSGNIFPKRPQLATTTIAIYFAGGGIGLMLSGVALPLLLEAQGSTSWPLAWRSMGYASLLMTVAAAWSAWGIAEPGKMPGEARWKLRPFAAELAVAARVRAAALRRGVIVRASADTVVVCPPLIVPRAELDRLVDVLDAALEEVGGALAADGTLT